MKITNHRAFEDYKGRMSPVSVRSFLDKNRKRRLSSVRAYEFNERMTQAVNRVTSLGKNIAGKIRDTVNYLGMQDVEGIREVHPKYGWFDKQEMKFLNSRIYRTIENWNNRIFDKVMRDSAMLAVGVYGALM